MTDDLKNARQRRERRRVTPPAGAVVGAKKARIDRVMTKVDAAAERRDPAAYYAGKAPTPQRITTALDMRELYGPEVDQALGGEEPMVDEWESGERVPDFKQMQALALLTGFPVKFFYMPPAPPIGNGWICGSDGCHPLGVEEKGDSCPECGQPRAPRRS